MRAIYKLSLIAAIATAGISSELEKQGKSVNLGEITVVSATGYQQNIQDVPRFYLRSYAKRDTKT